MTVITIEGRVGAGAPDIGRLVARELGLDFVDRLILAEIARRVGSTVGALATQEKRTPSFVNRLAQSVQRMLHRSAVAGMGGDPYFGPGVEHLLARPYSEMDETTPSSAADLDAAHFRVCPRRRRYCGGHARTRPQRWRPPSVLQPRLVHSPRRSAPGSPA